MWLDRKGKTARKAVFFISPQGKDTREMEDQITEQVLEETDDTPQGAGNVDATNETTVQDTGFTQAQLQQLQAILRTNNEMSLKETAKVVTKAYQGIQSMTQRQQNQINKDVDAQVDRWQRHGVQITPEMKEGYRTELVNEYKAQLADEAPEPAQAQTPQAAETNPMFDVARATVQRTANKLGVSLDGEDSAEFNRLWQNVNSPKAYQDFLDRAETYLEAKAKTVKTPPQARIPSLAGNGGSSKPTVEAYKKEVMAHQGDAKAIREIQERYTKNGLDISQVRFTQSRK